MEEEKPKKFTIKEWADDDKPREKAIAKGWQALSDAELLGILISTGTREMSAIDLAKELLRKADNSLHKLAKFDLKSFQTVKGIGEAKGVTIGAALELGRRRKNEEPAAIKKIRSSADVFQIMYPYLKDLQVEQFWVLLLNQANIVIKEKQISLGGINQTVTDTRVIFREAINELAVNIILVHNHPSGNNEPSEQDKKMTQNMIEAGKILGVKVLDHVIFADETYFSFADNGVCF